MAALYKICTLLIIMLIHFVKPLKPTVAIVRVPGCQKLQMMA